MTTIVIPTVLRVGEDILHHIGYEDTWVARYALNGGTDTLPAVIATISEVGNGCFLAKPNASNLKDSFFFKQEALQNGGLRQAAEGDPVLLVGIGAGRPYNWARFAWRLKTENRQLPDGRERGLIVAKEGALGVIKTYDEKIIGYRLTGKTASIAVGTLVTFKKVLDRSGQHIAEDVLVQ
jgi:hypothetical protein